MKHLIIKGCLLLACTAFTPKYIHAQLPQYLQEKSGVNAQSIENKEGNISYKVIHVAGGSYGYDIYVDGKLYIHQITIPSIPGNEGFKSKESAQKVAQLVKENIDNIYIFPNPVTSNTFTLNISNKKKTNYVVKLLNTAGQVLTSFTVYHWGNASSQTIQLPTTLPASCYYLSITQKGKENKVINCLLHKNSKELRCNQQSNCFPPTVFSSQLLVPAIHSEKDDPCRGKSE